MRLSSDDGVVRPRALHAIQGAARWREPAPKNHCLDCRVVPSSVHTVEVVYTSDSLKFSNSINSIDLPKEWPQMMEYCVDGILVSADKAYIA